MTTYTPIITENGVSLNQNDIIKLLTQEREKPILIENIQHACEVMKKFVIKQPEGVAESTGNPCSECGGIEFLKTGTCAVCINCGSSQGCS